MVDVATLEIRADTRGVKSATKDLATMSKGAAAATGAFKLLGAAALALGAGNVLGKIARDTRAFSSSISELSAITGAAGKDLEFLRQQSLEIGKSTTLSASQAATAFKLIASAKPDLLESSEALASVTKEAVTLAEAARIDLASAANTVGTSLNQFGAGAAEANRFINVLAAGSKLGASSISDTAAALINSGSAAQAAGVSFEEANAAIQVLAAGGVKASAAGTGLRNIILKLEADSNQKLRPSVVGLGVALQNLAAENLNVTEVTKKFGMEGVITASTLLKNADATAQLTTALTGTNIATEQAATNFDNLDGDLLSLNSSLEGLAIALGTKAEPNMRELTQALTAFAQQAINFVNSDRFAEHLKMTFNIAEALAILLGVRLVAALVATSAAFLRTATAAGVLGRGIALLGGPIGVITIAAFGLFEVLQKLSNTRVDEMAKSLTLAATQGIGAVDDHITKLSNSLVDIQKQLKNTERANKGMNQVISAGSNQVINLRNREKEIAEALRQAEERREALVQTSIITTGQFSDVTSEATDMLAELSKGHAESTELVIKHSDAYKDLTEELSQQMTQVGMTDKQQFLYNQQLKLGKDATLAERLEVEKLSSTLFDAEDALEKTTTSTAKLTAEQQIQKNMVENVQRSFGDLIYKTLDDGKINFKSFFNTVIDGFKRMIAELAAQNIMNAIFGNGGLNGFMSTLTSGFSNVISTIGGGIKSAIGSMIGGGVGGSVGASAAASTVGSTAGSTLGTAGAGAAGAGAGLTVAGTLASAGQFVGGMFGAGTGIAAGTVGPPTAAAAMGSKLGAVLFNPVTAAIAAALAVGHLVDEGGTPTSAAGITMAKTAGMNRNGQNTFAIPEFASGFAPLGFKQNATDADAARAIAPIRDLDAIMTQITKDAGFNVDLGGHTFSGVGVEGSGSGTLLGAFIEDGKEKGLTMEKQMDNYAREWIHAVGSRNGISSSEINNAISGQGAVGILQEMGGVLSARNAEKNAPVASAMETMSLNRSNAGTQELFDFFNSRGTNKLDGSHQRGLQRVPFDGYIAELHEGERVQTASQVKMADSMSNEMIGLRQNLNELMLVVAKSVAKTARIEDRWDKNGLPATRT